MKYLSILTGVASVKAFAPHHQSISFLSRGDIARSTMLFSEESYDDSNVEGQGKKVYADGGDEYGFNEPNPYADQYVEEEAPTLVTDEMEAVMNSLDVASISSEVGYVSAAKKRAEEARKKQVIEEEKGFSSAGSVSTPTEYKSSILLSTGAQKQADTKEVTPEKTGGVKAAAKSENNSDILFVDGEDDDGSLLVF